MREIKFRYVFLEKLHKEIRTEILTLDEIEKRSLRMMPMLKNEEVIARDQWTGMLDCKGNEIYEGDIVNFTYWWFDGNEAESNLSGEIVYTPDLMSYSLKGIKNREWLRHIGSDDLTPDIHPFSEFTFNEADFAVIGNIHQHKHLLEE